MQYLPDQQPEKDERDEKPIQIRVKSTHAVNIVFPPDGLGKVKTINLPVNAHRRVINTLERA